MPKKAGKKGGGKLAGLTEEERLLYMQQKAQAEEEIAKRKEDMLTHFLKDKLQKEEKNTVLNLHKLRQQWRAVLTQTKIAELRNDMSVLSQTFERVLDYKDNIIRSLQVDLSERELQSELMRSSHLHNVDCLLEIHKSRLAQLEFNFKSSLEELSSEYNTEREQILSQHQQECVDLDNVMFSMEKHYSDLDGEAKRDYQSTRNQIKKRNFDDKQAVKEQMDGVVEKLWQDQQQVLNHYNESTRDKIITTDDLMNKDVQSAKEIDSLKKHIQKLQDSISTFRGQLSSGQTDKTAEQLRSERDELAQEVQHFRVQLNAAQAIRKKHITKLTVQSNDATKKLQEIVARGERLLRQCEMCCKLETEHEKVLPFYKSSLSKEEQKQEKAKAMESSNEKLTQLMHDYSPLAKFWQRYNKVELDCLCVKREKLLLLQENERLRLFLKQYLDEVSVSDESFQQQKLLVVSSPALQDTAATDRHQQKRHVVQEAACIVQKQL
ncbi:dynein regulatory complex subunit 2 [Danio rerio]|uniref:dynein regulatory complex subunit 2 n=1 Tax=Danio rerio TaxID=7955 RepID=UPI00003BF11E|nr:dynein regulatory complex subunit 2 [Danio rerio]AAH75992.1 Coiled-coil domain containing 65 [Danio rerio]|eukprot:NP_001002603.1 dynein regulatory complex subunit 2 [Danio rerio]